MDVNGDLTQQSASTVAAQINTGTITLAGNLTVAGGTLGTVTIILDGSGGQIWDQTNSAAIAPGSITIDKSGGTLTLGSSNPLCFRGTLTHTAGTVDAGNSTVEFIDGAHSTVDASAISFKNITVSTGAHDLIVTGTMDVNGNLTQSSGTTSSTINDGTIKLAGNLTINGGVGGDATIKFDGSGNQSFDQTLAGGSAPDITIDKSGGTLSLGSTNPLQVAGWTYTAGTVDAGSSTVLFAWQGTVDSGAMSFNNVEIDFRLYNYDLTITDTMDVNGDLTLTNAIDINTGTIAVAGDVSVTDADVDLDGGGNITFDGGNTQTFNLSTVGALDNGPIYVNKSGGQVNLTSALTLDTGASNSLTIQEGTFDLNNNTLSVTGGSLSIEDGGNLQLQGGESSSTPTLNSGSTVTYDGTAGPYTVNDWNYQTLAFNAPGGQFNWTASTTYTVAENFNVAGRSDNEVIFRSTSDGTTWGINDTGASDNVCYADVKDSTATVGITAKGGIDSGNNTNWTFDTASGCYVKKFKGGMRFKGGMQIK